MLKTLRFIAALVMCLCTCSTLHAQFNEPAPQVTGFTRPYRTIDLAAPDMGTLSSVRVTEGDQVTAGEIVATLDSTVLEATSEVARRASESVGKLLAAEAEFDRQQRRHEKIRKLHERSHATRQELENAYQNLEVAQANIMAVQDELEVKKKELARIEAQLSRRIVRSTIDGIVTQVVRDEGEFVSANEPVVVQIVQLDPLVVSFSFPKELASKISADVELPFVIGDAKVNVTGVVEYVSPVADGQSGTCQVKVRLDNRDHRWTGGEICLVPESTVNQVHAGKYEVNRMQSAKSGAAQTVPPASGDSPQQFEQVSELTESGSVAE